MSSLEKVRQILDALDRQAEDVLVDGTAHQLGGAAAVAERSADPSTSCFAGTLMLEAMGLGSSVYDGISPARGPYPLPSLTEPVRLSGGVDRFPRVYVRCTGGE